jgi:hypothetical protein
MKYPITVALAVLAVLICAFSESDRQPSEADRWLEEVLSRGQLDQKELKELVLKSDLSGLWTKTESSSIFGFIGEDYQRLSIHFSSVHREAGRRDRYIATGKTRVKRNICNFQGTITVATARKYTDTEFPEASEGVIISKCLFKENPRQRYSGSFEGVLMTDYYIDPAGHVKYDDFMADADGFSNNQFVGVWRSYSGGPPKRCHWGDYRIPFCGDLDVGAGEFWPDEKYRTNGWEGLDREREGESDDWWK